MMRSSTKAGLASLALVIGIATPLVSKHEGLRTKAYLDPVGIPTICFGETLGVRLGDRKSVPECEKLLATRLEHFVTTMRSCTTVALPAKTEAAFLTFSYNVGLGTYCKNFARKRINTGNVKGACDALLLYTKAGRPLRVLPGLVKRRQEERALCLEGLREESRP